jgi:hypothetical protein
MCMTWCLAQLPAAARHCPRAIIWQWLYRCNASPWAAADVAAIAAVALAAAAPCCCPPPLQLNVHVGLPGSVDASSLTAPEQQQQLQQQQVEVVRQVFR